MDVIAFQPSVFILPFRARPSIGTQHACRQYRTRHALPASFAIITASASQSLPTSSDIQPSANDHSEDLPSDFGAQLAQTLQSLGEKVSATRQKPPTAAEIFLDNAKQEDLGPEEVLKIASAASQFGATDRSDDDLWTDEQSAMLSLIHDDDDTSADPALAQDFSTLFTRDITANSPIVESLSDANGSDQAVEGTLHPVSAESSPFDQQSNPCSLDVNDVKRKIGSLKRRRHRLAIECGEDAVQALDTSPLSSGEDAGPLAGVIQSLDRENARNIFAFSLARMRIVNFPADAAAQSGGALTTKAEHMIANVMCCPFVYRPFFGMQAAFEILDNPPCPRCRRPTSAKDMSMFDLICVDCYREIYLEGTSSASANPSRTVWQKEARAETALQETRAAEEAVTVSMNLLHGQSRISRPKRQKSDSSTMSMQDGQQSPASITKSPKEPSGSGMGSKRSGNTGNNEPSVPNKRPVDDGWNVRASARSMRTINPIRNLIQNIDVKPNPDKDLIKLSVGDPTVYGNLKPSERAVNRYCEIMQSSVANGYSMSMGSEEARYAVAKRYTTPQSQLTAEDVILTAGTSGALEIAIGAIANEGDNVLLPRPGFPLFRTIAEGYGVECRYYSVKPDKSWEIELSDLVELADSRTAAIIVNNPSNPCGSVYSATHIEDLVATASMLRLPIIADEVYADMVFSGSDFTPVGSKSVDVPVLSVGGVSKQFVVPGWRLGWILIHDRNGVLEVGGMRKGMRQLTTRMLVPNSPTQAVLPTLLDHGTRDPAFRAVMDELEQNADFTMKALASARGLRCIEPQGAMYVMAEIDVELLGLRDDMEFTEKLLEEEAVFVLPGQCFQAPNFVRIVFSAPKQILSEAFFRMRSFCARRSGSL